LWGATWQGYEGVVKLLIEEAVDSNAMKKKNLLMYKKVMALWIATNNGCEKVVFFIKRDRC